MEEGRGSGCLECTCEVLNINRGYNQELMDKCRRLWEYSELTSEIEENIRDGMGREDAVHTAIDACITKGILTDILLQEKGEVTHMLLTKYDEKRHLRNTFEEGRKEGRKEGFEEGIEQGIEQGIEKGVEKGREEKLRELVQKKFSRGKAVSEIAEELEEELSVIEQMIKK